MGWREKAKKYYEKKDEMHGLKHIERMLKRAKEMHNVYGGRWEIIEAAAWLHGLRRDERKALMEEMGIKEDASLIERVADESQKESLPKTVEGKILHDAHLLEGGELFFLIKALWTGCKRGQSLEETLDYIEEKLLFKFDVAIEENRKEWEKRQRIAKEMVERIRRSLS